MAEEAAKGELNDISKMAEDTEDDYNAVAKPGDFAQFNFKRRKQSHATKAQDLAKLQREQALAESRRKALAASIKASERTNSIETTKPVETEGSKDVGSQVCERDVLGDERQTPLPVPPRNISYPKWSDPAKGIHNEIDKDIPEKQRLLRLVDRISRVEISQVRDALGEDEPLISEAVRQACRAFRSRLELSLNENRVRLGQCTKPLGSEAKRYLALEEHKAHLYKLRDQLKSEQDLWSSLQANHQAVEPAQDKSYSMEENAVKDENVPPFESCSSKTTQVRKNLVMQEPQVETLNQIKEQADQLTRLAEDAVGKLATSVKVSVFQPFIHQDSPRTLIRALSRQSK